MSKANKKRLHFGVLLTTVDNACLFTIWKGIAEYAEENDIHLTAYFGTYQSDDEDFFSHLGTCFEMIKSNRSLDGVILFTGFISKHIKATYFDKHIAEITEKIPVISVSYPLPGIPSVLVDNTIGIYDAVEHMIKIHGKKKIAFIKGPDGHPEAEARLEGYKKALAANGIAFDERYVFPGNFSRDSGRDAVIDLIEKRKLSSDAIVASDDQSAIGVLMELKRRGIVVPSDIAVTGFDDDKMSAFFTPSLGTVRQGLFNIGQVSALTLHKKINGDRVDEITYVAPEYVPRQSCGCFEKDFSKTESELEEEPIDGDTLKSYALRHILPLFGEDIPLHQAEKWIESLVSKIKMKPFNNDRFQHLMDEILIDFSHYSQDFSLWFDVLRTLSSSAEFHVEEVENIHVVLSALFFAPTLVSDIRIKEERTNEYHLSDARVQLRRLTSSLIILFDIDALAKELYKELPKLEIKTALIGLYSSPVTSDTPNANRTIDTLIGYDGDRKFNMKHNSWNPILLSEYSTIDGFNFDRELRTLFFIPLFFKDEEVGVMLLSYDPSIPVDTYETLRISLSTSVKGAALLSKIQELSITDELTGLYNRRGFFQFSFSRLPNLYRETSRMPFVMFMDMDGLKTINDTYGHNEGDIAISAFAKILKEALREEDITGRVGGDEFVVFSSVKSIEDGNQVVSRIREKLDEYNKKKLHPYDVQGSIGSVILDFATKECFEAAILDADNVLYKEKMEKKKKGLTRQ